MTRGGARCGHAERPRRKVYTGSQTRTTSNFAKCSVPVVVYTVKHAEKKSLQKETERKGWTDYRLRCGLVYENQFCEAGRLESFFGSSIRCRMVRGCP